MEVFEDGQLLGFCEPARRSRNPVKQLKLHHWGFIAAAVVGAYASYRASKKSAAGAKEAARLQAEATGEGLDWQKEMYADFKPYLMKGLQGYQKLLDDPSAYKKTPGYQFRLQEGLKSVGVADGEVNQRNLTGSQLKAISRYSQDYATTDYDRALQRYAGMAGISQGVAAVGATYGQGISNTLMQGAQIQGGYLQNAANARAAGYMGMSRAVGQGLSNYGMTRQQQTDSPVVAGDANQPGQDYYNQ